MASAWKQLRRLARHLRRSAHHALNLVLIVFLAGQTLLAFYLARRDSLEPPAFLVERLRAELAPHGLRLDWDRAVFDLKGNVRVDRPRAGPALRGEVWASADVATARLDRVSLLFGKIRWREITVENLAVTSPGDPFPVVAGLSLHLRQSLGEITVDHAYGRVLGVETSLMGPLGNPSRWFDTEPSVAVVPTPDVPPPPAPVPGALAAKVPPLLKEMADLARTLQPWHETRVRLAFVPAEKGPPRLRLELRGHGNFTVEVPGIDDAQGKPIPVILRDWELKVGEWGLEEWSVRQTPSLRLRLDSVELPQMATLSKIRLETSPAVFPEGADGWRAWLHQAKPRLSAGSVTALGQTIGPVGLATTGLDRWPALEGRLWTRWEGRPVSVAGRINPIEGSADAVLESAVSCAEIFSRLPEPVRVELDKRLAWEGSPHLSPRVVLGPGWKFARAELQATVTNFRLKPATVWDELTFHATATPEGIEIDRTSTLCREVGYAATASYTQRWDDTSFLLQVEGRVRPRDLDPVLTDSWWSDLWRDLTDFPELPFAMVTVGGRWNQPQEIGARVVSMLPAGGRYRGVKAGPSYVLVAHSRVRTELSDLKVERPGGEWLRGSLGWTDPAHLPVPQEGSIAMDVNLRIRANLTEVAPLLGPDFGEVTKTLRLSAPPVLAISGWSRDRQSPPDFDWRIQAVTEGLSGWKQFDFETLSLDLRIRPGQLDLTNVKGRFLDGDIAGNVFLKTPGDLLDLDLSLANASWPVLLDWAKNNQGALGPAIVAAPAEPATENAPAETKGRVWLTLKALGPASDPVAFNGGGTLRVEEAELQTVRIFGGLSRLLETLGADFATFDLNRLESVFSLGDKTVVLESLKVEGPRARMTANGSVRLTDRALDIDADLELGKPREEKNIIGRIFTLPFATLAKLLPIKLFGTLDEPSWRFKADPRSLIFGQPGMKPETPTPITPTPTPTPPNE